MSQLSSSISNQAAAVRIPRIIHQIWYQGEKSLPEKYRQFRSTWRQNHPEWEFILWDETSMRDFIVSRYSFFKAYYDGYPLNIQRMDSARYFILNTFGGFYIDIDVESLKPIDGLLGNYQLLLSETIGYNNAIIGSVPQHPLWQIIFKNLVRCYDLPRARWFEFYKRSNAYCETMSTGPIFFSRSMQEGGFDKHACTRVCPGSYFEPDFPRRTEHGIIRSSDHSQSYALHFGDLKWLPPMHRYMSAISGRLFQIYWKIVAKKSDR